MPSPNTVNSSHSFGINEAVPRTAPPQVKHITLLENKEVRFTSHNTYFSPPSLKINAIHKNQRIHVDYSQLELLNNVFKYGISISPETSDDVNFSSRYLVTINTSTCIGEVTDSLPQEGQYRIIEDELLNAQNKKLFNWGASLTCNVAKLGNIFGLFEVIDVNAPIH